MNSPARRLLDRNSHIGTFVNGKRVKMRDLGDGDEIKAGHTLLRLAILGG